MLSNTIPHGHLLHYWVGGMARREKSILMAQVKDSLFKNPAMGALLRNAGNIGALYYCLFEHAPDPAAVDRKTKNNQKLFKGTFDGGF